MNFFFLHIKKAGGTSFRDSFSPPYIQTNRTNCKTFIALPKEEWNDCLNNYKIPLGEYDYKRMLFAKKYLYTEEEFDSLVKFVIIRNPYDRLVSCWKYLYGNRKDPKFFKKRFSFTYFLEDLPKLWETKYNRHNATHTAPFWEDITDFDDNILVDKVIKLEEINDNIDFFRQFRDEPLIFKHSNKNRFSNDYRKYYNKKSKTLVEKYFKNDIEKFDYSF